MSSSGTNDFLKQLHDGIKINTMFNNMPLKDLLECRKVLDSKIELAYKDHRKESVAKNINDFVEVHSDFVTKSTDNVLFSGIQADVESLNLPNGLGKYAKQTTTKWLTQLDQPYSWSTKATGNIVTKEPVKMS